MLKKIKQIKNVLNNEKGSPSLEQLIGIGVSLGGTVALYKLTTAIFGWINAITDTMLKYNL